MEGRNETDVQAHLHQHSPGLWFLLLYYDASDILNFRDSVPKPQHFAPPLFQVQTTTMCISVSLSGFVVLGCLFAPKVHIILFQPQKNVVTHRLHLNRFSVSGTGTTYSQCK